MWTDHPSKLPQVPRWDGHQANWTVDMENRPFLRSSFLHKSTTSPDFWTINSSSGVSSCSSWRMLIFLHEIRLPLLKGRTISIPPRHLLMARQKKNKPSFPKQVQRPSSTGRDRGSGDRNSAFQKFCWEQFLSFLKRFSRFRGVKVPRICFGAATQTYPHTINCVITLHVSLPF